LYEAGRLTKEPVFVIGVFSGTEKLAEGFGSSLKMAEFRVIILVISTKSFNIFKI